MALIARRLSSGSSLVLFNWIFCQKHNDSRSLLIQYLEVCIGAFTLAALNCAVSPNSALGESQNEICSVIANLQIQWHLIDFLRNRMNRD